MYSVYQHWDPLKVCAVGRSYPPEYYTWIENPKLRTLFEKIARETEEDYQKIIAKLQQFGVDVVRAALPNWQWQVEKLEFSPPPMNPRDCMVMIGEKFYCRLKDWQFFYNKIKDPSWPDSKSIDDLDPRQRQECEAAGWTQLSQLCLPWQPILDRVRCENNSVNITHAHSFINGACVTRMGRDLYFSVYNSKENCKPYLQTQFPDYRIHVINTLGHGDGTYCPVAPGLIISLKDVKTYENTFPGWEVIYLPDQSWDAVKSFLDLKKYNGGRWWIPGWEYDQNLIDLVETWLSKWVGYVEETVFDVNMLIVDPKNVIVFNENDKVFRALERYGMTPHVVTFRHRYFWDGGIHCVTLDLDRQGHMQDFFPDRNHEKF